MLSLMRIPSLIAILSILTNFLSGCDYLDRKQTTKALGELETQIEGLSKSVQTMVENADAPEELKKLQQYEYRVDTYPAEISGGDLAAKLSMLGKDRWDCFHVERRTLVADEKTPPESQMLVLCKRRPDTPLRYLPRSLIGTAP